eukprot:COSAG02_NODE_786_length_17199_cov_25.278889_3_plen_100_part_00
MLNCLPTVLLATSRLLCTAVISLQHHVPARPAWGKMWRARYRDRWRNARLRVHRRMERHLLHGKAEGPVILDVVQLTAGLAQNIHLLFLLLGEELWYCS